MKVNLFDYCVNLTENNKYNTGVYKIYHSYNKSKLYVGSASSAYSYGGFYDRFRRHVQDLILNRHHNNRLQNVVNKYGMSGLKIEIIEICLPKNCIIREQWWIDKLDPFYNISKIAGSTLGVKPSSELIKKRSKQVLQYDLDGNFIKEFINVKEVEKLLGFNHSSISQCCRNNNVIKSHGFQWRYKKSSNFPIKIESYKNPTAHKILCYSKKGNFLKEFDSILVASNELNLCTGNISRVLSGKCKFANDYIFRKYTPNYPNKIPSVNKIHKNQIKIHVKDLLTNETLIFPSFRSITNSGIIARSTLTKKIKDENFKFIWKKKYMIKLEYINN